MRMARKRQRRVPIDLVLKAIPKDLFPRIFGFLDFADILLVRQVVSAWRKVLAEKQKPNLKGFPLLKMRSLLQFNEIQTLQVEASDLFRALDTGVRFAKLERLALFFETEASARFRLTAAQQTPLAYDAQLAPVLTELVFYGNSRWPFHCDVIRALNSWSGNLTKLYIFAERVEDEMTDLLHVMKQNLQALTLHVREARQSRELLEAVSALTELESLHWNICSTVEYDYQTWVSRLTKLEDATFDFEDDLDDAGAVRCAAIQHVLSQVCAQSMRWITKNPMLEMAPWVTRFHWGNEYWFGVPLFTFQRNPLPALRFLDFMSLIRDDADVLRLGEFITLCPNMESLMLGHFVPSSGLSGLMSLFKALQQHPTLEYLTVIIDDCYRERTFNASEGISFPALRILNLYGVSVTGDDLVLIQRACPMLEVLDLDCNVNEKTISDATADLNLPFSVLLTHSYMCICDKKK
jgi:hypothetical protein